MDNVINLVITDFAIVEAKKTRFASYRKFCEYVCTCLNSNQLATVVEYIQNIVDGCNQFLGFGQTMFKFVFRFFIDELFMDRYRLVTEIIKVYGHYIHKEKVI